MAAARKVSHAASSAVFFLRLNQMGELGGRGGLAGAVDADNGNHGQAVRCLDQVGRIRAQALLHFGAGDGKHVRTGTALGFVGVLDGGHDLGGRAQAEIGGDERGFQFLERGGVEFGRACDDAFDFMRQLAVGFLQAGLEFLEKSHVILTTDGHGWTRMKTGVMD